MQKQAELYPTWNFHSVVKTMEKDRILIGLKFQLVSTKRALTIGRVEFRPEWISTRVENLYVPYSLISQCGFSRNESLVVVV